jgi:group I intron endonuclease
MIIYKVTNKINNNVYIGKTIKSLSNRKWKHIYRSTKENYPDIYFHNALRKYGSENFEWDIIHRTNNEDHLNELEKFYIKFYRAKGKIYNMTDGGEGGGSNPCNIIREKISKIHRGKHYSLEFRKKMSEVRKGKTTWMKGKHHSEESNQKNRIAHIGKKLSAERIEKLKNHIPWNKNLKNCFTEATRLKMSESHKGKIPWNKGLKNVI